MYGHGGKPQGATSIFVILGTDDILRLAGTQVCRPLHYFAPFSIIETGLAMDCFRYVLHTKSYWNANSMVWLLRQVIWTQATRSHPNCQRLLFCPILLPLSQLVLSTVLRHASLTSIFYCFVKNMLLAPHLFSGSASSIHRKRVVGL